MAGGSPHVLSCLDAFMRLRSTGKGGTRRTKPLDAESAVGAESRKCGRSPHLSGARGVGLPLWMRNSLTEQAKTTKFTARNEVFSNASQNYTKGFLLFLIRQFLGFVQCALIRFHRQ
jgi:hypothetical protein